MKIVYILLSILLPTVLFAQNKHTYGESFPYNLTTEKHTGLVLVDNYGGYLFSITEVDGMQSQHTINIRKIDQANNVTANYEQSFKSIDASTLYNYLGHAVMNDKKVLFLAESYSGKAKQKIINAYIFDKSSNTFTTKQIASVAIESNMKSGTTVVHISDNGKYIGIINQKHSTKKEPVANDVWVLDAGNGDIVWTKTVNLEGEFYEKSITTTNSGNLVLVRAARGFKLSCNMLLVSKEKETVMPLEENMMLQQPIAVSIGQADYLIAFNYNGKGLRKSDFEKLMVYDLANSKILANNEVKLYNGVADIKQVDVVKVFLQNNEMHLFTQAQVKGGTRQVKVNQFSTMTMEETWYKYGLSTLFVLNFEGLLKEVKSIQTDNYSVANLYHSFGVLNIKGKYAVNGGDNVGTYFYDMAANKPKYFQNSQGLEADPYRTKGTKIMTQLFAYLPDSKKFLLVRMHNGNEMSVLSFTNDADKL